MSPTQIPDIEWIFGYGSLMWRPGFPFLEQVPGRLLAYHRAPCIYSHHHRGTVDVPGLVLGLDAGGFCDGIVFRIDINKRPEIIDYLYEREMIGYAYKPEVVTVEMSSAQVQAYTFVADSEHNNYAGDLGIDQSAALIMRAEGVSGLNRDYLMNTVQKLEEHGFAEPELLALLRRLKIMTGELDQGGGI